MKRFAILIVSILSLSIQGRAQTFTQHIQQRQNDKGSVTVVQSKEIDDLVNGNNTKAGVTVKANDTPKQGQQVPENYTGQTRRKAQETVSTEREKTVEKKEEERKKAAEKAAATEEKKRTEAQKESEEEMNIPTVDMRKKVMRNARKVTGYRVQAYAGGNTRADKQRAQQIGEAIKMRYPDQPIYVHFYSPRWICRVGNYRSYSEASRMLRQVKAMGYKGATIVKGKITVFE